jgi:DNA-binding transcriptional LysR family regulator
MVLDSQEAILRMVESGLGVAILPLADEVQRSLRVHSLPFGEPHLTRKIVLLEHPSQKGGRLAAALAKQLIELADDGMAGESRFPRIGNSAADNGVCEVLDRVNFAR